MHSNWPNKNLQTLLTGIIFFICYAILIGHCLKPLSSLDTYWHLQMGLDYLDNGLSPWLDHYSFTFPDKEIISAPILFQLTLATLVSFFGEESGFIVFKTIYISMLLFVFYLFFKKVKAPWLVIYLILPALIYFVSMRLIVRPDVISNVLTVICLIFYLRARDNFNTKTLIPICLLLLFWVNYHSPILGYIIIFGLFLDKAVNKIIESDHSYSWAEWFGWGVIVFLIGFINPTFDNVLILIFSLSDEWYQYLSEYSSSHAVYSTNTMVLLSLLASIFVVPAAVINKHYGLAFIVALLTYYAWSISRLVPAVSIINLCILTFLLSQVDLSRHASGLKPMLRLTISLAAVFLFIFSLSQTSNNTITRLKAISTYHQHIQQMHQYTNNKFPAQISDYLNNFQSGGKVLNTFNVGGYLIHALSPSYKIYIDGRTNILYPVDFYKHYLDILNNSDVMEDDIKKYDIDYAIFENTSRAHRHFNKIDLLNINFANENYILLSRKNNIAFPLASKLTHFPMCWNNRFTDTALKEISLSTSIFSNKNYTIKNILDLLDGYLSNNNKKQFIRSLKTESLSSDILKRLAAYLALNDKNFLKAKIFFNSIQKKNNDDMLVMSYTLMKTEEYGTSKSALAHYLNNKGGINKDSISDYDKIIIIKILTAILEKSESKDIASFDINTIKENLGIDNIKYAQSLIAELPDNSICDELFKF